MQIRIVYSLVIEAIGGKDALSSCVRKNDCRVATGAGENFPGGSI